ncbi:hypothetical protein [Actinoplanes sp. NPDC049599]|uniref:hypothetical protein n=1 Tax=Actinoplanes sp. NPDC049599 TaxID=3363903 RepID=UPI003797567A
MTSITATIPNRDTNGHPNAILTARSHRSRITTRWRSHTISADTRRIYVTPSASSLFSGGGFRLKTGNNGPPDQLPSAVELLEARGWEVVTVDVSAHVRCMRRIRP